MSNDCQTVYVSADATVEEVQAAVDAYLQATGADITTFVEFGDEYPGYVTAVDVYGESDAETAAAVKRLAAGIAPLLPGVKIAIDLELYRA